MSAGDVDPELSIGAREGAMLVTSGCRAPIYCPNRSVREDSADASKTFSVDDGEEKELQRAGVLGDEKAAARVS